MLEVERKVTKMLKILLKMGDRILDKHRSGVRGLPSVSLVVGVASVLLSSAVFGVPITLQKQIRPKATGLANFECTPREAN